MISVVIPCYNQQEYLPDAIESVLSQSVLPCEIIVVDDGSTDNSGSIADRYAESHGVKVIHQVNKGLSSARNTGIMNSTGDYVVFLDADDILKENYLEKVTYKINESKSDIIAPSFKAFGIQNGEVILKGDLEAKSFAENNRIGYFSAVRRSALLEIGGYSPRMNHGYEDWHLWIDLLKRGKTISIIHEVLVLYRTKEVSMITEAKTHDRELRDQIKKDHPQIYA